MNKKSVIIALSLMVAAGAWPAANAEDGGLTSWLLSFKRFKEVEPMRDEVYIEECGSCHFPYQAGLLPESSWRKLMSGLEDHFGDNAELDAEVQQQILDLLVAGSADKSHYKRSKQIVASLKQGETPIRMTETAYIRRKHHEIPDELVKGNAKVKSLAFCNRCHQQAEKGIYDDDTVEIPGKGRWTW